MYSRAITFPENKSFFLFGPRGTGKTTWVRKSFPDGIFIDLLDSSIYNTLLPAPQRLKSFIPPEFDNWVVIDEIQRIPSLSTILKRTPVNCRQQRAPGCP